MPYNLDDEYDYFILRIPFIMLDIITEENYSEFIKDYEVVFALQNGTLNDMKLLRRRK